MTYDDQKTAFAVELANMTQRYMEECPDITYYDYVACLEAQKHEMLNDLDISFEPDEDSNLLDEDEQDDDGEQWKG